MKGYFNGRIFKINFKNSSQNKGVDYADIFREASTLKLRETTWVSATRQFIARRTGDKRQSVN
jgi:hypothetical protein